MFFLPIHVSRLHRRCSYLVAETAAVHDNTQMCSTNKLHIN